MVFEIQKVCKDLWVSLGIGQVNDSKVRIRASPGLRYSLSCKFQRECQCLWRIPFAYFQRDSMPRLSRTESQAKTREALMESARAVFVELGTSAASVDMIAERAGYSKGAFYSNFPSKEAILMTLFEQHMEMELLALQEVLKTVSSLEDLFKRLGTLYKGMHEDPSICVLDLEYQLMALRNPDMRKRYQELWNVHEAELASLLDRVTKRLGVKLNESSAEIIDQLAALCQGIVLQRSIGRSRNAKPVHTVMINFLKRQIKSEAAA